MAIYFDKYNGIEKSIVDIIVIIKEVDNFILTFINPWDKPKDIASILIAKIKNIIVNMVYYIFLLIISLLLRKMYIFYKYFIYFAI